MRNFVILLISLSISVMGVVFLGEEGGLYLENIGPLSLSFSGNDFSLGLNYSTSKSVVTVVERPGLFGKKIKIRMKVKDEYLSFHLLFWRQFSVIASYEVKSLFPIKSESYSLFVVSKDPFYFSDSISEFRMLGIQLLAFSTTLNGKGYSFGLIGYKNIYLGYFRLWDDMVVGVGSSKGDVSVVSGFGWDRNLPSIGFTYSLKTDLGYLGMSLVLGSSGLRPGVYFRLPLKDHSASIVVGGDRILLSVH